MKKPIAYLLSALLLSASVCAEAARSLRETVCIQPDSLTLDSRAAGKIGKLVEVSAQHEPVVGAFITVFVRNDSLTAVGDGISAASTLVRHLKTAERGAREWPFDLKFFPVVEQICPTGNVLVELSISFDEKPLADPKR